MEKTLPETRTPAPTRADSLPERLHRALGPIAGGLIIDFVDLATIGPIGLFTGLLVGGVMGWWVASIYRFSPRARAIWALCCGIYCTIPFTAPLPLMTFISAFARFGQPPTATR